MSDDRRQQIELEILARLDHLATRVAALRALAPGIEQADVPEPLKARALAPIKVALRSDDVADIAPAAEAEAALEGLHRGRSLLRTADGAYKLAAFEPALTRDEIARFAELHLADWPASARAKVVAVARAAAGTTGDEET